MYIVYNPTIVKYKVIILYCFYFILFALVVYYLFILSYCHEMKSVGVIYSNIQSAVKLSEFSVREREREAQRQPYICTVDHGVEYHNT